MTTQKLSRRHLLKTLAGISAGLVAAPILAACQPQIVEVTKVVEREKIVKEVVKETVVVKSDENIPRFAS